MHIETGKLASLTLLALGHLAWLSDTAGAQSPPFNEPKARIFASDTQAGDRFSVVAIDGDTMVVGAYPLPSGQAGSGAVYVFHRNGSGWLESQKISSPPGVEDYGSRIVLQGSTLVVAAPSFLGHLTGTVFVYREIDGIFMEETALVGSDVVAGDLFGGGNTLELDGDTLAIPAPAKDNRSGTIYVYLRNGSTWTEQARLRGSDAGSLDRFGFDLSLQGDTLVSSAWASDLYGYDNGVVYVFQRTGTTWSETTRFVRNGGWFGRGLDLDGDTLVVAAQWHLNQLYVFQRNGSSWNDAGMVTVANATPEVQDDLWDIHLKLQGDTLLVGSASYDQSKGRAWAFRRTNGVWHESARFAEHYLGGSSGDLGDQFASDIALDGDEVYIGAPLDDNSRGMDAGAVMRFDLEPNEDCALTGWWKGDGDATDSSGFGNNGALHFDATYAPGLAGQAFSFDGSEDHVRIPDNRSFQVGRDEGFTVDCWVNPVSLREGPYHRAIICKRSELDWSDGRWTLDNVGHGFTGQVIFWLHDRRGNQFIVWSNTPLQIGVWTHIAVVRDGSKGYLYLNGVLDASAPISNDSLITTSSIPKVIQIGSGRDDRNPTGTQPDWAFDGRIDSVGFFKRALSPSQVLDLYQRGPGNKCPSSDTTPPLVAITVPSDGLVTGQSAVAVTATVDDEGATTVSSVPVGLVGTLAAPGGVLSGVVNLDGPDGPYTIVASATDEHGNVGGDSVTVELDRTPPALMVLSPANGAVVGDSPATLVVQVADVHATLVTIGGQTRSTAAGGGTASFDIALQAGLNEIDLQAIDAAGNPSSLGHALTLDTAAPVVTISSPVTGASFGPGTGPVGVDATVLDLSATSVNSTPVGVAGSLPAGGGSLSGTVELVEGLNTISVSAVDQTGRQGSDSVVVTLDTTPPEVAVAAPAQGAWVRGTIDFHATASDVAPGTGIERLEMRVDGDLLASYSEEPYEAALDTAALADGAHELSAWAYDGEGNSATALVIVLVDNTPPELVIHSPSGSGIVHGGSWPFMVVAGDTGAGLTSVVQRVGGLLPAVDASQSFADPVAVYQCLGAEDTTRWPNAPLEFSAQAIDAAGNTAQVSVLATVDNAAPPLPLLIPGDGELVSGTIWITATADSASFESLEILADGQSLGSSTTSPFSLSLDTRAILDGSLTLQARLTGLNQVVSTATSRVTIDNLSFALMPTTLNLGSKGGANSVTASVQGENVALLSPPSAHGVALLVPGGSPVLASATPATSPFKFDRQQLIAAIRAGRAANLIQGSSVTVTLVAEGGRVIGTDVITIVGQ